MNFSPCWPNCQRTNLSISTWPWPLSLTSRYQLITYTKWIGSQGLTVPFVKILARILTKGNFFIRNSCITVDKCKSFSSESSSSTTNIKRSNKWCFTLQAILQKQKGLTQEMAQNFCRFLRVEVENRFPNLGTQITPFAVANFLNPYYKGCFLRRFPSWQSTKNYLAKSLSNFTKATERRSEETEQGSSSNFQVILDTRILGSIWTEQMLGTFYSKDVSNTPFAMIGGVSLLSYSMVKRIKNWISGSRAKRSWPMESGFFWRPD